MSDYHEVRYTQNVVPLFIFFSEAGGYVSADGRVDGNLNLSRSLGDFAYKKDKTRKANNTAEYNMS